MQVLNTVGSGEDAVGSTCDNTLQVIDTTSAQNNCDIDNIIKEFEQKLNVQVSTLFSQAAHTHTIHTAPCRADHKRYLA